MAVTMKDIAQVVGVSTATVSKVLNGTDQHISQQTRDRILSVVKERGYVPNAIAKGLKVKQSKMLGFVLPDISNPFFPEIARGIEDTARNYGFGMVIYNTDDNPEKEREALQFLSSRMVDGIIFIRSLQRGNLDKFFDFGIPLVLVDRESGTQKLGFGQVFIDTQKATYEATNILIQAGCTSIGFISAEGTSLYDRYDGFCRALAEAGLTVTPDMVYRDRYHVETGYAGMVKFLKTWRPDGVICGNDLIAVGVLRALRENGLQVPQEVRVMGFDDIYFSQYLSPPLSTVHQPAYQMGVEAASMLLEKILHNKLLGKKQLPYKIQMRNTV